MQFPHQTTHFSHSHSPTVSEMHHISYIYIYDKQFQSLFLQLEQTVAEIKPKVINYKFSSISSVYVTDLPNWVNLQLFKTLHQKRDREKKNGTLRQNYSS